MIEHVSIPEVTEITEITVKVENGDIDNTKLFAYYDSGYLPVKQTGDIFKFSIDPADYGYHPQRNAYVRIYITAENKWGYSDEKFLNAEVKGEKMPDIIYMSPGGDGVIYDYRIGRGEVLSFDLNEMFISTIGETLFFTTTRGTIENNIWSFSSTETGEHYVNIHVHTPEELFPVDGISFSVFVLDEAVDEDGNWR